MVIAPIFEITTRVNVRLVSQGGDVKSILTSVPIKRVRIEVFVRTCAMPSSVSVLLVSLATGISVFVF